ncbi:putative abortive infection phage resistance protein [Actinomadura sp. NBRC 104412]|uniref:AIPR family protein n=1 Tax=Actinomadura sp. NBRC 104412 TaxID=3032203 RepID=UPI0024A000DE|nr:AIPR family protein [Actinomadura sp. NBRC 104412]GLZ05950.1 putative abortive infection phage resistance protein [Actinomadura sp. NBRC 104412]
MRKALLDNYKGRIYEADLEDYPESEWQQRFLSRALAAEAIRLMTGCDFETAGRSVIDGDRDQGIDAIAVSENTRDVWLVQAKWSDLGKAKIDKAEALKFADGVRLIGNRNFEPFNKARIEPFTARLDAALGDPRLRIRLVIALLGPATLYESAAQVIDRLCSDANVHGPLLEHKVLGTTDFHALLQRDVAPAPINVKARMWNWGKRDVPFEAWQGSVGVSDIARWYAEHGDALYEENVRKSLGATRINAGIKETLSKEPENFWYFNNGITVLCDGISYKYLGKRMAGEPIELTLKGVSVVNGAQTVTAIHEVMGQEPGTAPEAEVTVRLFSLGDDRPEYAKRITETTNTQNDVTRRDFIALDPAQAEIRQDFLLSLGKTYVYKRGEPDPDSEAGCSVVHAATALACAHRTPELAVRASRDTDLLWERGAGGAYPRLFGETPTAHRIWRCVQVRRAVGVALEAERRSLQGRAADMARRGELLVTHMVFQLIDLDEIDDPALDWEGTLASVPELTASILPWLIHHVDEQFPGSFLSSTFNDERRCRELARLVLADVRRAGSAPVLSEDYRPSAPRARKPRRPNAVPTLVNAGVLADGTPLTFEPRSKSEKAAVRDWLAEDGRRSQATWVNDRRSCLLWAYDEEKYSPSGLVQRIWELARYENAPVSVQGPARWMLADGQSLWDLALRVFADEAEAD